MSARDDYPILVAWARGMTLEGFNGDFAEVAVLLALDEIDRLRAELTVANNRLGNAVGALIDAGMYCTGVDDVTAGIDRLRAEREAWEAFRQTVNCPSCGGTAQQARPAGWDQRAHLDDPNRTCDCHDSWDQCPCAEGGHVAGCNCCPGGTGLCGPLPCRDCTDGKIDMARLIAVGAAAVAALTERDAAYTRREHGDMANWRAMDAIETALRQVRP